MGGDGPAPLQFAEEVHVEAGIAPAIAGEAMSLCRFAFVVADKVDPPALGEQVEDALFSAGYIHGVLVSGPAPRSTSGAHENVSGAASGWKGAGLYAFAGLPCTDLSAGTAGPSARRAGR